VSTFRIVEAAARHSVTAERWSVVAIGVFVVAAGWVFGWMGATKRGRYSFRRHPPVVLTTGQKVVLRWFTTAISVLFVLGGIAIIVSAFVVNLDAP
jgi:hypothetical protein